MSSMQLTLKISDRDNVRASSAGCHDGWDAEGGRVAQVHYVVSVLGVEEQPVRLLERVTQLTLKPVAGL